jgi:hypothetical protein
MDTDGGGGIPRVIWTTEYTEYMEYTEYTEGDGVLGAMVLGFGPSPLTPLPR